MFQCYLHRIQWTSSTGGPNLLQSTMYGGRRLEESPELVHPTTFCTVLVHASVHRPTYSTLLQFTRPSSPAACARSPPSLSRRIRKLVSLWRESGQRIPAPSIAFLLVAGQLAGALLNAVLGHQWLSARWRMQLYYICMQGEHAILLVKMG